MSVTSRLAGVVFVWITAGVLAAPLSADEDPTAVQAEALLDEGTRLFAEEADYVGALQKFQESYDIQRSWKALNGMALVYQQQGRYLSALETYERLLLEHGTTLSEKQRTTVENRVHELGKRIAVLAITATQAGVHVLVDGREVGTGPYEGRVRLLPGTHSVLATKDGFVPLAKALDLPPGRVLPLHITLVPTKESVRVVVQVKAPRVVRRFPKWLPWVTMGSGVALVALGGTFSFAAKEKFESFDAMVRSKAGTMLTPADVDDADLKSGELLQGIGIGLYVAGGVGVVAGIGLYPLSQPRLVGDTTPVDDADDDAEPPEELPLVPTGNGAVLRFRF
jgi:hypothetical protein